MMRSRPITSRTMPPRLCALALIGLARLPAAATTEADQMEVEYREITGCPGYRVSNTGIVQTCRGKKGLGPGGGHGSKSILTNTWKTLKTYPNHHGGHLRVVPYRADGTHPMRFVHHLVLEAFVGPCPEGMEACHFPDSDPKNNSLCNLRWGTHADNEADKVVHGTAVRGEMVSVGKLTTDQAREIFLLRGKERQAETARRFNVSINNIGSIQTGRIWGWLNCPDLPTTKPEAPCQTN